MCLNKDSCRRCGLKIFNKATNTKGFSDLSKFSIKLEAKPINIITEVPNLSVLFL